MTDAVGRTIETSSSVYSNAKSAFMDMQVNQQHSSGGGGGGGGGGSP